jgi:ABC-type Na+ efflux pump permease subunit
MLSREILASSLTRALREQRLVEANVSAETRRSLFRRVELQAVKIGDAGEERDSGGSFLLVFGFGFIMYLAILMYGQVILGAVIEEKETRIAEILFSSVMVTTAQEGGQLAMPIILILVVSFYLFLPVSRSPDSTFSFWVSMLPFSAPVAMLVRIVTQTPPFWQIALSLLIGFGTVLLIMWFASRVYRVGMLMYGKRASLPEAWRWVRQA